MCKWNQPFVQCNECSGSQECELTILKDGTVRLELPEGWQYRFTWNDKDGCVCEECLEQERCLI